MSQSLIKIYHKNKALLQDLNSIQGVILNRYYYQKLLGGTIFISTICNANCVFCANKQIKNKRSIMSFSLFKKTVKEFKKIGLKNIGLTPMIGEVFTDPKWEQKINYLHKQGFPVAFYTNGFFIRANLNKILKAPINRLLIDLADIDSENEAKVFRVPKKLCEDKLKGILELIGRNKNIKIHLSFRPLRDIKEIKQDMKKTLWEQYYIRGKFSMDYLAAYDNWGGLIKEKDLLGVQMMSNAPKIKVFPCKNLFGFSIFPDGLIRACSCRVADDFNDELVLGNINEISIKKAFESKKYDELLQRFPKRDLPKVCKECSFYSPKID